MNLLHFLVTRIFRQTSLIKASHPAVSSEDQRGRKRANSRRKGKRLRKFFDSLPAVLDTRNDAQRLSVERCDELQDEDAWISKSTRRFFSDSDE